jgi:chromosome partitioning protein
VYIISFANQKGGVGKTTSAVNTASALGVLGKKTLLIDLDPQGSSTSSVGIVKNSVKYSSYEVLTGICSDPTKAIIETKFKNLYVMPSNILLAAAELELATQPEREQFLKKALDKLKQSSDYDYVIIDCPPSLGIITLNALTASRGLIVPVQCEYFALEGLSQLMNTYKSVKKHYNSRLNITGILITMFNPRYKLSSQVLDELEKYYSFQLFDTKISRSVALSEAPSFGEPIYYYSKYSKVSLEYMKLAEEIVSKIEGF